MLFHVFAHIDPNKGMLIVEQEFCQRPRHLRLADARGAQKDEGPDRPGSILQARS